MAGLDAAGGSANMDYTEPVYLNVTLRDIDNEEVFPLRHFPIGPPWSFKIGRGSQSELNLQPQDHNSWFGSRVMSREHATITADPETRVIEIEDTNSMHGTYVHGKRLDPLDPVALLQHGIIVFGADIVRGDVTYRALKLQATFEWSDGNNPWVRKVDNSRPQNTFSSDYHEDIEDDNDEEEEEDDEDEDEDEDDDDGDGDDDDVQVITVQRRTFSVPDSDDSDVESEDEEGRHSSNSSVMEDESNKAVAVEVSQTIQIEIPEASVLQPLQTQSHVQNPQVIMIEDEQAQAEEREKKARLDKLLQDTQIEFDHAQRQQDQSEFEGRDVDSDINVLVSEGGASGTASGYQDHPYYIAIPHNINEHGSGHVVQESDLYAAVSYQQNILNPGPLNTESRMSKITSVWPAGPQFELDNASGFTNRWPSAFSQPAVIQSDEALMERLPVEMVNSHSVEPQLHQDAPETTTSPRKQFAKVSISDIIHEENNTKLGPSLKRKAGELSTGEHSTPQPIQNSANDTTVESAESQPRKRVKSKTERVQTASSRGTVASYAATAVFAAAVGAVSAVFGLAALPAEYFA